MPFLNFSTDYFPTLPKFDKFVKHVLSRRNHQVEVSSLKLRFRGAYNQGFLKKIAKYALSHNVQELTLVSLTFSHHSYPPCLFSSQSLKHFTLTCGYRYYDITQTALDFPALTTLNLSDLTLSGDLFSKCVNLKNLTLERFHGMDREEVFNIITPRLSNLTLIHGNHVKSVNVIAPQLENLTIIRCSIDNLNAPPGISSFCYTHLSTYSGVLQFCNDRFYSLNKVTICLVKIYTYDTYTEEFASKSINMLQKLQSAKYLTLNADIVECLSKFPSLLSCYPSPFSNLICLTIDYSMRENTYKVTMPNQVMKFLLDNSPTDTFIIKLPAKRDGMLESRMDSNRNNVRRVVEDRLSSLPDELIHKILSCFDIKFAVQTCVLSSRWESLWTSIPCLNFSSDHFRDLQKFAKFVKHVLSHRNHQTEVSSVKLRFRGAYNQGFVKKIANYALSHNVQELTVVCSTSSDHFYPPCLFSSQSLKQFTLTCKSLYHSRTITRLDFPALTTLNLSCIKLCGDLFSKCVNLKNLTLKRFYVVEVFDIITPRLSDLTLFCGFSSKAINVIAPQLENLTIIECSMDNLNAPPGISSFFYTNHYPHLRSYDRFQFCNDRFYSLNKVTICLAKCYSDESFKEEHARKSINMLQKLQTARFLTLDADTIESADHICKALQKKRWSKRLQSAARRLWKEAAMEHRWRSTKLEHRRSSPVLVVCDAYHNSGGASSVQNRRSEVSEQGKVAVQRRRGKSLGESQGL
ncbi:hypothetical protein LXL04_025895 [Taraxacum kok-saghyz]